ncbi:MAG TPA: hypothetical protein VK718_06180 [Ferruginibacter sp.]|jgi:hypothetical protein|nr:hypothetical protein [Ferruginibacter sp.]
MNSYRVTYRVDNTNSTRTLQLRGGTESEAKERLYGSSSVPRNKTIIIIKIERV